MQKSKWQDLKEYILKEWEDTLPTVGDFINDNQAKQQVHMMLSVILEKMAELEQRPVLRGDETFKDSPCLEHDIYSTKRRIK